MVNRLPFQFFKTLNQQTISGVNGTHLTKRFITFDSPFFNRTQSTHHNYTIPYLSSLSKMREWAQNTLPVNDKKDKTLLIGVQHILPTTVTLFQELMTLGFKPNNILFADKVYSTVPDAVKMMESLGVEMLRDNEIFSIGDYNKYATKKQRALWDKALAYLKANPHIDTIIILDEGGRCIEQIPQSILSKYKIIAIEQTRGGLYNSRLPLTPFPVINVAASHVKKQFESKLIADALIRCLERKLPDSSIANMHIGIVGYGAIGQAVAEYFTSRGHKVFMYDKTINVENRVTSDGKILPDNIIPMESEHMVAINSDCILGCTGKDITKNIDFMNLVRDTVIVSCSSEDKEVNTLIKKIADIVDDKLVIPPTNDLILKTNNGSKILVTNGGCPINFDGTAESDPHEMALTRLLLMGSLLQCLVNLAEMDNQVQFKHQDLMLDPYIQYLAAKLWSEEFKLSLDQQQIIDNQNFLDSIKTHSGGDFVSHQKIETAVKAYNEMIFTHQHDNDPSSPTLCPS